MDSRYHVYELSSFSQDNRKLFAPNLKFINLNKKRLLLCFAAQLSVVTAWINNKIEFTLVLDSGCKDLDFRLEDDNIFLYCLTVSGSVYCIHLKSFDDKYRLIERKTNAASDKDIFADLLEQNGVENISSSSEMIVVESDNLLLKTSQAEAILVIDDHLAIISKVLDGWLMYMYDLSTFLEETAAETSVKLFWSHYIPGVTPNVGIERHTWSNNKVQTRAPWLQCLYPFDGGSAEQGHQGVVTKKLEKDSQKHIVLSKELYNQLFGLDSNLLNSPVLLAVLPGGEIYYNILKNRTSEEIRKFEMLSNLGDNPVSLQFFDLPLSESACKTGCRREGSSCLLLCGGSGKVLSVTASDKLHPNFRLLQLLGPVYCLAVCGDHIVYSTGRDLMFVPLKEIRSVVENRSRSEPLMTLSAGYRNVLVLTQERDQAHSAGDEGHLLKKLYGVTSIGKLVRLEVRMAELQKVTSGGGKNCGQRIKNLLTGINNVWENLEMVQKSLDAQDVILQQLSLASIWTRLLSAEREQTGSRSPLDITVRTNSRYKDGCLGYSVIVKVLNRNNGTLGVGWSLLVTLTGQNDKDKSASTKSQTALSKSVQFFSLQKDEFQELTFEMDSESLNLPLCVNIFLLFSINSCIRQIGDKNKTQSEKQTGDSDVLQKSNFDIVIPIYSHTMDILQFLTSYQMGGFKPSKRDPSEVLRQITRRRSAVCFRGEQCSSGVKSGYTVTVHVSAMTLKQMFDQQQHQVAQELLKKILSDSCVPPDTVCFSTLKTVAPCGRHVTLSVQASSHFADGYDISILSPSLSLVSEVRTAITLRIQTRKTMEPSVTSVSEIRRTLRQIEDLKREVLSVEAAVSDGVHDRSELLQQTLQIYQQLRLVQI